jgi:hypothetical protein
LAIERLTRWKPARLGEAPDIAQDILERTFEVMSIGWAPGTHSTYGSGLLMWHVWCDRHEIAEARRGPAETYLVHGFIADCAGGYVKGSVENAILGLRAWHLLHRLEWSVSMGSLKPLLQGVANAEPPDAHNPPRAPLRVELIERIAGKLRQTPFDLAWFACLTTTFWGCARLGEFTVKGASEIFDPKMHIYRARVTDKIGADGSRVKDFFLPWTKVGKHNGEHVFWAAQTGPSDPLRALVAHLAFNDPPDEGAHLFSYPVGSDLLGNVIYEPMRRQPFLRRLADICDELGEVAPPHGHGIRIGSAFEYLRRGKPFDVVKVIGRWGSDSFETYLRDHAVVLAPYLQALPELEAAVARFAMPRRIRRA